MGVLAASTHRFALLSLLGSLAACGASSAATGTGAGGDAVGMAGAGGGGSPGAAGGGGGPSGAGGDGSDAAGGGVSGGGGAGGGMPTDPSPGCTASTSITGGHATIDVSGTAREYILSLPAGYDPRRPYPLVIAFHGAQYSAQWLVDGGAPQSGPYYGIQSASMGGAIFVASQALSGSWTNQNGRDIDYVRAMVARFQSELCVDRNRIFATGFSMGGIMTNTIACGEASVFRAAAACRASSRPPARATTRSRIGLRTEGAIPPSPSPMGRWPSPSLPRWTTAKISRSSAIPTGVVSVPAATPAIPWVGVPSTASINRRRSPARRSGAFSRNFESAIGAPFARSTAHPWDIGARRCSGSPVASVIMEAGV